MRGFLIVYIITDKSGEMNKVQQIERAYHFIQDIYNLKKSLKKST